MTSDAIAGTCMNTYATDIVPAPHLARDAVVCCKGSPKICLRSETRGGCATIDSTEAAAV